MYAQRNDKEVTGGWKGRIESKRQSKRELEGSERRPTGSGEWQWGKGAQGRSWLRERGQVRVASWRVRNGGNKGGKKNRVGEK